MRIRVALLLLVSAACSKPPDRVFVPGQPFTHTIDVRTAQGVRANVRVGEWLTLHGRRSTGPWTEVDRAGLGPNGCWVAPPPPREEAEVGTDVTWTTLPAGEAEFDNGLRDDRTRRVRFSSPGTYVLRASSDTWCSPRVPSNELTVTVTTDH